MSIPLDITTPPLPDDSETLDCDIDADFINGVGTSLNTAFSASSPHTFLGCALTTALTNDAYQNKLLYQGETSLDNTEPFNQGTLVFGTVNGLGSNEGLPDHTEPLSEWGGDMGHGHLGEPLQ